MADDLLSIANAGQDLPKWERSILKLRFYDDMTQTEIAREVGLSQTQISRLLDRSLAAVRATGPPASVSTGASA